jgi:integrase
MFLSKAPSGMFHLFFTNEDGKRCKVSTRCTVKSDALQFLRSFDPSQKKKSKPRLLSSFIDEFLSHAKVNYRPATVWIYKNVLDRLHKIIGDQMMIRVTPLHWDKYKTTRLASVSPLRTNIELRSLRAAFNTAMRWEIISKNPFSKQALCTVPEKAPVYFTKEDFQTLINVIREPWLKEMVIFAALTGLRRSEIINLRWSDVDLNSKFMVIQSNATYKTKQGKRRVLPLNDIALYMLCQKVKRMSSEYVFTLNGNQVKGEWLSHKFKYYVYECKFPEDRLHFHSLRHTFASWLVQDGASLFEVQKLLGHADAKTTMIYSHLQPQLMHHVVNKINVSFN